MTLTAMLSTAGCGEHGAAGTPVPDRVDETVRAASPLAGGRAAGQLTALEESSDSRIGLFAVDTATGRFVAHRAEERFAFASTGKVLTAAAVLEATDDSELDAPTPVEPDDVVPHSPVTESRAGAAISLREAAEAAVTVSDNTAQNIMLEHLGGPAGLEAVLRGAGDATTDPARYEPELNEVFSGDTRDTTTPRAMTASLRAYLVDGRLSPSDRDELVSWMEASTTGQDLVRAAVPAGWVVADKSGTPATSGGRNDVALVWPPGQPRNAPWVITVFTDRPGAGADAASVSGLVASATAAAVAELADEV
ncbi:class A beta-lactamase [Streptomyces sp. NP160]|uniref:class A beta-lactamase n=1 Tax=Streptomyces sp. NP160 TaxID=2586637 RepID=UPI00111AB18C|nr:class A beta-lactamase [Streptomyces sp. NP160]TNM59807.1 class A beta-lactamase [Streptomyces sp. NP160]